MSFAELKDVKSVVTIKGLPVPSDWDETGNIIKIAVSTFFEEEYLVEPNPRGKELFPFLRQKVKISGRVRVDDHGRKVVRVKEYEVIEE